jgi:hypothetical protein
MSHIAALAAWSNALAPLQVLGSWQVIQEQIELEQADSEDNNQQQEQQQQQVAPLARLLEPPGSGQLALYCRACLFQPGGLEHLERLLAAAEGDRRMHDLVGARG